MQQKSLLTILWILLNNENIMFCSKLDLFSNSNSIMRSYRPLKVPKDQKLDTHLCSDSQLQVLYGIDPDEGIIFAQIGVDYNANWTKIYIDTSEFFVTKQNFRAFSFKCMNWFDINHSRSRFVLGLKLYILAANFPTKSRITKHSLVSM